VCIERDFLLTQRSFHESRTVKIGRLTLGRSTEIHRPDESPGIMYRHLARRCAELVSNHVGRRTHWCVAAQNSREPDESQSILILVLKMPTRAVRRDSLACRIVMGWNQRAISRVHRARASMLGEPIRCFATRYLSLWWPLSTGLENARDIIWWFHSPSKVDGGLYRQTFYPHQ
jgi:hypothetical protein